MGLSVDATEQEWMSEAQSAMISADEASKNNLHHDSEGAGIPSTHIDKSPSNFAWPIPDVTRRIKDYKNVHTEYRDNYHEWGSNKV